MTEFSSEPRQPYSNTFSGNILYVLLIGVTWLEKGTQRRKSEKGRKECREEEIIALLQKHLYKPYYCNPCKKKKSYLPPHTQNVMLK